VTNARAGRERGLDERTYAQAVLNRFFREQAAASMTEGFDVFVQLVIAAMSTEPWPMSPSMLGAGAGTESGVAGLLAISRSCGIRRTGRGTFRRDRILAAAAGMEMSVAVGRDVHSLGKFSRRFAKAIFSHRPRKSVVKFIFQLRNSIRSCGRFGPATLGTTLPRSSSRSCE